MKGGKYMNGIKRLQKLIESQEDKANQMKMKSENG